MPQEHHSSNPFTAEEIELGLMALVKWSGSATRASRYLKSTGRLDVGVVTLGSWKETHAIRFDELREKHSAEVEETLAHEMRDVAGLAIAGQRLAIEKATEALEKGWEKDPARAAASLARVSQSATDKLMTLTARPTQITETRNLPEILRSLAAKGVIQIPQEATSEGSESGQGGHD